MNVPNTVLIQGTKTKRIHHLTIIIIKLVASETFLSDLHWPQSLLISSNDIKVNMQQYTEDFMKSITVMSKNCLNHILTKENPTN